MRLTVYFAGQFWVGVVEEHYDDGLRVARHIFGAEPSDTEVLAFVNRAIPSILTDASSTGTTSAPEPSRINPKRRAREAAAEVRAQGISTHAQLALKQEFEARKQERAVASKAQRDAEREARREQKRQQAKEKHKGH